jgi:hypothetical protein
MMKKLNLYYIVSIITLVFMMFILFRTLQVTGWFEDDHGKSPAERVLQSYAGLYQFKLPADNFSDSRLWVEPHIMAEEENWLMIRVDSLPAYLIEVNDFEDQQTLLVIYGFDSTGTPQRLEGCELLLEEDIAGNFRGSTIGDFCGLTDQSLEYLALDLVLSDPIVLLKVQRRMSGLADSLEAQKYLLERIDSW